MDQNNKVKVSSKIVPKNESDNSPSFKDYYLPDKKEENI